jgi:hypothetical protein
MTAIKTWPVLVSILALIVLCASFSWPVTSKPATPQNPGFCAALSQITGKFDSLRYKDLEDKKIAEKGQDKMYTTKVLLPGFKAQNIVESTDEIQFWATYDKTFNNADTAKQAFEKLAGQVAQCLQRPKKSMEVDEGLSYVFYGNFETGAVYLILKENIISIVVS